MTTIDSIDAHQAVNEQTPAETYERELNSLSAAQSKEQRRERLLGYTKLALAAFTLIAVVLFHRSAIALVLLSIPAAVFIVLAIQQEKLLASIRYRTRALAFYERGLARLHDRWAGSGETGEQFLDPAHPYARDLDLFGTASLFQFLSTARTHAGEETLAHWLLAPASVEEIVARQAAVRDLRKRVKFRERLSSTGETVRLGVHPDALSNWGESQPLFTISDRVIISALAILWLLSIVLWIVSGSPLATLLFTILNFGYSHRLHARMDKAAGSLESAAQDLQLLADVLALIEKEHVSSPRLLAIQAALERAGIAPSAAIHRLAGLVDVLQSRHSLIAKPIDLVTFWSTQLVFVAEKWQRQFGPEIRAWLRAVGEFEALTSLSSFSYEHPEYAFPEFVAASPSLLAESLAHPLLPAHTAVENDLQLNDDLRLMILSGPNMAGKSTFIRSIGVNAVLAQCGAPVRARRMQMSPLTVAASICVLDSLAGGMSRFYAEIHRVKLIADLAEGPIPVLFLLDELLSGTNSHDRLVGTQFVLQKLLDRRAIGIVSTHDLALSQLPDMIGTRVFNCHFEDRLEDNRLLFDYKLRPGVVKTSNALKLMQSIGLGVSP